MHSLALCFFLEPRLSFLDEKKYAETYDAYKLLGQFLYANPDFRLSIYLEGNEIFFLKKNHPEFIKLLQDLSQRKQLEFIGGGFYNPLFPLLSAKDRVGQIEALTSEIRKNFGKRPRGAALFASAWDFSLVSNFAMCGMNYVFLDTSLLKYGKHELLPYVMSDRGKTVSIVALSGKYKIEENLSADEYINLILSVAKKSKAASDRILAVPVFANEFLSLSKKNYFEKLLAAQKKLQDAFYFSTPSLYLEKNEKRIPVFIPSGCDGILAKNAQNNFLSSVYDYVQADTESSFLAYRMFYVSMLISQSRGDKARKKTAMEKLWESQKGIAFVEEKKRAFQDLCEAEKLIRQASDFSESLVRYDYNGDGSAEYLFRMQAYTACISREGGSIFALDCMHGLQSCVSYGNFSGENSFHGTAFFSDVIFPIDKKKNYAKDELDENAFLSHLPYVEKKLYANRKEVLFAAEKDFGEAKQKISIRKKYTASSNGFLVQYILRNESNAKIDFSFASEISFCAKCDAVISVAGTVSQKVDFEKQSAFQFDAMNAVQILDEKALFVFDTNENASILLLKKNRESALEFLLSFLWDFSLDAGSEAEKTINMSIAQNKKKKKA